ncbi:MAG: methyltransferase domain-containing protein, partial [Planctomycetota bacterium]|nr:methyltransferase domain-containing protein [Planctomycetota bacterium]
EGIANRAADGRVYTTPYQMEEAQKLYGVTGPSLVLYNYVSEGDLPRRRLPKLSKADGQVHIVYEGGVRAKGHRDFSGILHDLAARGLHVHVYPMKSDEEVARKMTASPNLHCHQSLSPKEIIEEMTQYDFGIIPFKLDEVRRRFLDTTIANKLFEYLAAGLPVITSDLRSYREYFREHPVGVACPGAEEIVAALPALRKIAETVDLAAHVHTFEQEAPRLVAFYRQVMAAPRRRSRTPAPAEAPAPAASTIEEEERRKYEEMYRAGYTHHAGLKPEIVAFLERYVPEFETAVDLGCGTGKYADFLQQKHGKMVLGVDIVQQLKFPNIRFRNQFAWDLDAAADFIYAIDLLEHVPEAKVDATCRAIAGHTRLFFADVSTLKDKLGDKIGKRLHVTLRPSNWWVGRLAEVFEDVKVLGLQPDGFFVECRHEPVAALAAGGRHAPDFAVVTGRPSSSYRDFWNQHAASLPWRGRVLYVGTNEACRAYYNAAFFGAAEVVHVDIDPAVHPDVVASAENMPMFPDQSVDGIAFFGTPYVVSDPAKMAREFLRVLRPGGLVSGAFNGAESPWTGVPYRPGEVKAADQVWHFDRQVRTLFEAGGTTLAWARHGDAYYYLSAVKGV